MLSRSHRRVLKALLPVVLSGCAVSQSLTEKLPLPGRDRYREQLLAARMAEQSGELLRARNSYEALLKRYPDKMDLHHRLGVLCQKSGDEPAAIGYLNRAHELSPTNVEVLCDLGYSHYLQGNTAEAVDVYRRAQQINPTHPRTQSNLGIALIDMGEISTAMTTLRQSMSEADAASTVGFALAQKGDLLQAREYFTRAIDADPTSQKAAEALVQLGELLAAEHNVAPGSPVAGDPAGHTGGTVAGQLTPQTGRPAPETVDFESLYSQKIEQPVKAGVETNNATAAEAIAESVTLSAPGRAVVESFMDSADTESGMLLPPIESVQPREHKTVAHTNGGKKVQLSHTSLRADESAAESQFANVDPGLEDLAGFVESSPASSPVQGVRSLEDRRRSGGLIEPMLGASDRMRRSDPEAGYSLPPVLDSVEHGPRRRAASERSAGAEKASVSQGPVDAAVESTADAAKAPVTNLPTVAPQAVPTLAQTGAVATAPQMVLVRDASGQFYQMPLVMPTLPTLPTVATPQAALQPVPVFPQIPQPQGSLMGPPVATGAYPQTVQQIAFRSAGEMPQAYPQGGSVPVRPQIFANGQPINPVASQTPTAPQYSVPLQYPVPPQYSQGTQFPQAVQNPPVPAYPLPPQYGNVPQYPPGPEYGPGPQYSPGPQYNPRSQYAPGSQPAPESQQAGPQPFMPQQSPAVNSSPLQPVDGMQPLSGVMQQYSDPRGSVSELPQTGLPALSVAGSAPAMTTPGTLRAGASPVIPIAQPSAASQHVVTPAAALNAPATSSVVQQLSSAVAVPTAAQQSGSPASVGGLPLAFLRSFYAQMSPEQQALFWQDLRQTRGASAAEKAAYRELAESSRGLAQIEAAITMLVAFEELALADRLLTQAAASEDPTLKQAANTALAMLPVRSGTRH